MSLSKMMLALFFIIVIGVKLFIIFVCVRKAIYAQKVMQTAQTGCVQFECQARP